MVCVVGRKIRRVRHCYAKSYSALVASALLGSLCFILPAQAGTRGDANSVTVLTGKGTDTDFTQIIIQPWTTHFVDQNLVGIIASHRLGTLDELTGLDLGHLGEYITVEPEAGASYRFGDKEDLGEFWGALYFRYDGFFWNDSLYTTVALDTGLSLLTETSDWEASRSSQGTSQVLHYFSPEITFADPDNKNVELVLRLYHRSGIFGAIDGVHSGSTFVTTGLRFRF
jgi:hypothetical protein